MNGEIKKIIIPCSGKTSDERDIEMLKLLEKQLKTGPIISDARDVILVMSRNIMIRDYILDAMGVNVETREKMFAEINHMLDKQDAEILAKRKLQ